MLIVVYLVTVVVIAALSVKPN